MKKISRYVLTSQDYWLSREPAEIRKLHRTAYNGIRFLTVSKKKKKKMKGENRSKHEERCFRFVVAARLVQNRLLIFDWRLRCTEYFRRLVMESLVSRAEVLFILAMHTLVHTYNHEKGSYRFLTVCSGQTQNDRERWLRFVGSCATGPVGSFTWKVCVHSWTRARSDHTHRPSCEFTR